MNAIRGGTQRRSRAVRCGAKVLVGALTVVAGCASGGRAAPAAPAAAPIERALAVATFDSAWSRIHDSYYDASFRGLDWAGVRDELRPRAEAAGTIGELRGVLGEMLGRLGESHFAVIPRETVDALDPARPRADGAATADAGLDLRWVEGELTVVRVQPGGAAEAAGVRRGWIVDSLGERDVARWKSAIASADEGARRGLAGGVVSVAGELLRGPEGSAVRVRFRDAADRPVELSLARRPIAGEAVRFGNLPAMFARVDHERVPLPGGDCAGVVHLSVWMPPAAAAFDRAVDAVSDCRGVVIDLRGNPGGVTGMVMGAAGHFLAEPVPLGVMQTRQNELRFVANPRRTTSAGVPTRPYAGPVAILIDPLSASTSEIFASGMQSIGRARVFGETSAGQALSALMLRLPNEDVLYHAIANLIDPRGNRLEGVGVAPDEAAAPTRAALLAGRDRALDAALAWIDAPPAAAGAAPAGR